MATHKGQGRGGSGDGKPRSGGKAATTAASNAVASTHGRAQEGAIPVKARFLSDVHSTEFRQVQEQILNAAERNGYQDKCLFAIKIAVEEALVNAIKHGNRGDKTKHVTIEANISPQEAEITIEDEGPGFHRGDVPDPLAEENIEKPSGRGILLIESYMTQVSWDQGGRRVRMIKRRADERSPGCMAHG
jgi:serine/threonine-protein kinase RsbW